MGRSIDAVKKCQRALEIEPDNDEAHCGLGATHHDCGEESHAIAAYDEAICIKPKETNGLDGKGRVFVNAGRTEQARECYETALSIEPSSAVTHLNLSLVKKLSSGDGQIVQLETLYGQVDRTSEDRRAICFALANAYEDLGDLERSFGHLMKEI